MIITSKGESPEIAAAEMRSIGRRLDRIMLRACDRTQPHRTKPAIIVQTEDWHALMDLAIEARAALSQEKK